MMFYWRRDPTLTLHPAYLLIKREEDEREAERQRQRPIWEAEGRKIVAYEKWESRLLGILMLSSIVLITLLTCGAFK